MKNLLWFAYVPADEREESLFAAAYKRSLSVLWIAITLLIVVGINTSAISMGTILIPILLVSYLAGWWTIRNEDMTNAETGLSSSESIFWFLAIGLGAVLLLVMIFNPAGYIRNGMSFIIAYPLLLILWAFRATKSWRLHARILLNILLPFVSIAITRPRRKLLTGLVLFVFPLAVMVIIRLFIVFPIFVNTNAFEPELNNGEYALVYKINQNYAPQDLVVVNDGNMLRIVRADSVSPTLNIQGKVIRQ